MASSGGATANELAEIASPSAGTYWVCVIGFGSGRRGAVSANYTLSHWLVAPGTGLANSLRVSTPATVITAGTGSVALVWATTPGRRYYTTVQFSDGSNAPVGRTALYIDSQGAAAPTPAGSSKALLKAMKAAAR